MKNEDKVMKKLTKMCYDEIRILFKRRCKKHKIYKEIQSFFPNLSEEVKINVHEYINHRIITPFVVDGKSVPFLYKKSSSFLYTLKRMSLPDEISGNIKDDAVSYISTIPEVKRKYVMIVPIMALFLGFTIRFSYPLGAELENDMYENCDVVEVNIEGNSVSVYEADIDSYNISEENNLASYDEEKIEEIESENDEVKFSNIIFCGDSNMLGYSQYLNDSEYMDDTTYFLAQNGCSATVAVSSSALSSHSDVMPTYNENPVRFEDGVSNFEDAKHVFLCLGINDLVISSVDKTKDNIEQLCKKIQLSMPDVSIHIISVPYINQDVNKGYLNNDNIVSLNGLLQLMCLDNDWGFIDASNCIGNSNGIYETFSKDGYVHLNADAYKEWDKVFVSYISSKEHIR